MRDGRKPNKASGAVGERMIKHSFLYHRDTKILTAAYDGGAALDFFDVPLAFYDEMVCAQSQLEFFNKRVWNSFEYSSHHHTVEMLFAYISDNIFGFPDNGNLNVNSQTYENDTPLHIACIWGDLQAVDLLLTAGSRVDAKNDMGYTPLHFAEAYGHRRCVHKLLAAGAQLVEILP